MGSFAHFRGPIKLSESHFEGSKFFVLNELERNGFFVKNGFKAILLFVNISSYFPFIIVFY